MLYTFEIRWPAPFSVKWQRSGKRLATLAAAADAMRDFILVSAENDAFIEARLVAVREEPAAVLRVNDHLPPIAD